VRVVIGIADQSGFDPSINHAEPAAGGSGGTIVSGIRAWMPESM